LTTTSPQLLVPARALGAYSLVRVAGSLVALAVVGLGLVPRVAPDLGGVSPLALVAVFATQLGLGLGFLVVALRGGRDAFAGLVVTLIDGVAAVSLLAALPLARAERPLALLAVVHIIGAVLAATVVDAAWRRYRHQGAGLRLDADRMASWLEMAETSAGFTVAEMSRSGPVMLVFLRHFGCTFCRQALTDLGSRRGEIERDGTRIVVVHMSEDDRATETLKGFGLAGVSHVRDSEQELYRAFGIDRGTLAQLASPTVVARGLRARFIEGIGLGAPDGDVTRLAGVFIVADGHVVHSYRHRDAADRPDFVRLARCTRPGIC
jgi:peroxiredoxin